MDKRPQKISESFHTIEVSDLGREVARGLQSEGFFHFSAQEIENALLLSYEPDVAQQAMNTLIDWSREVREEGCSLMKMGFVLDEVKLGSPLRLGFTYMIQSHRFENDPLLVTELFDWSLPTVVLVHSFAEYILMAYERRPVEAFLEMARGG